MGSGLIYAAIIAMWGAYFIPRWVRRHEELSETRSVDRFAQTMRILSRTPDTPEARDGAEPPSRNDAEAPRSRRPARRVTPLAMRRRRILAGLLLVTVVVALLTPWTPVPWQAALGMIVCTVAFLVHLRVQARRASDVSRSRESVRRRATLRLRRFDSVDRILAAREALSRERAAALAARLAAEAAAEQSAREQAERLEAEAAWWQPVPVPLPTYVSKPRAPERPARPLPEHELFDQTTLPVVPEARQAAPAVPDEPDELDEIIERRRAVND